MKKILNKKMLILAISTLMIIVSLSSLSSGNEEINEISNIYNEPTKNTTDKGTHTVIAEYGTATWCGFCKYANQALKNIFWGGTQDFTFVTLVESNSYVTSRLNEYNLYGYPTVWFDGGDEVVVGAGSTAAAEANYNNAIDICEVRTVYDVDIQVSVVWQGSATMQISASIQNNEGSTYDGTVRVYVVEKNSTFWSDTIGQPYGMAMLNYAFNQVISIGAGGSWSDTVSWNGNDYGFGSITEDNVMVVGAVFNDDLQQGYSYPPSGNPFDAYYCDDSVAVTPNMDSGPCEINNVAATPSIQASGGSIEISADVIDDAGVDQVQVVISDPTITIYNETMTLDTGDTYTYDSIFTTTGTYSYHIWAEDVNGNQNNSDTYTFEIMNPHVTDLSSKWNFVSLNLNQSMSKTDLIINYNNVDYTWDDAVTMGYINNIIFGWDRPGQYYTFSTTLEPGYGYWLYAYVPCEIWVPIMSTNIDDHITNLEQNWNIIGSCRDESMGKTDIIVNYNGFDYTWDDAVTMGYINNIIFGWDRPGQYYTFSTTLEPGYSYWVFSYQNCILHQ